MPEIVGYELRNSAAPIDCEIWQHDGVLNEILGDAVLKERDGGEGDISAEELLGILASKSIVENNT